LIVTVVQLARPGGLRSVVAESLLVKHGTVRRECLDRTLFWTATDLEAKLLDFQHYYNEHRTPAGRQGYPSGNVRQRRSLTSKSQLLSMAKALSRLIPNTDCRPSLVIRHRNATVTVTVIAGTVKRGSSYRTPCNDASGDHGVTRWPEAQMSA
jgi:hypothetical protein